jgi:hypothetical protein
MKPSFALSLSFEGIRLLHRAAGGWHLVGQASVSDPELSRALADLRAAGVAHDGGLFSTKLIIPDEQIKYLSIDTSGMDNTARLHAATQALDGATPYPVDALAFDISPDGDTTHVAAVARETLLEAESFAVEHGFGPVSFVAAAEGTDFLGEPFFGPTAHAKTLLPPGTQVEPDGVRVVVVEEPAPVAAPAEVREHTPPVADPAPADDPQPVAAPAEPEPTDLPKKSVQAGTLSVAETPLEDIIPAEPTPMAAPALEPVPEPDEELGEEPTAPPPLLGFATRRRQDPSSGAAPARLGGVSRTAPPVRITPTVVPAAPDDPMIPPAPNLTAPPKSSTDSLRPTPVIAAPEPTQPTVDAPSERTGSFLSRRKRKPETPARKPDKAKTKKPTQGELETERMTVFGARGDGTVGGKPRFLGLILMVILLVFLAGVAAWATVFMDDGLSRLFPGRERTLASTLPDDTRAALAEDVGATTQLEPDMEELADDVVMAALNDSLSDEGLSAEDAAVLDALRSPLPDPVAPEELDAAALEARYAVTGIWPKAPDMESPAPLIDIEDLYVTGIDPVSPALDAVALPSATSFGTDRQVALITSPVAAGTSFARDQNGRVIPTAAGSLSPDGFTVFLGRPPAVPPAVLARLETGVEVNRNTSELSRVRPRDRPTDLVEQNERATLGGLSRDELAGLRPRLRPQAPQDAPDVQQDETAEPTVLAAVAPTLRPAPRPRNFDRIVARATPSAPATAPEVRQTAAVAPRTVTPSIPSTASVAREATVSNAINLRRVNLIGVYGTPSERRALVRLPNGRYQKVEVGDRFDGGRVSAIGDSELRYQKSGRSVVLTMPKG